MAKKKTSQKKHYKEKIINLVKNNWIVVVFIMIVTSTVVFIVLKSVTKQEDYVYAKIRVSQGLWWANAQRPTIWYAKSIVPGLTQANLSGKPTAEIVSVRYYPWWGSDTYDVYMIVKLEASKNYKTGTYSYNRNPLTISSPIELMFPSVEVSGTVMELSETPIEYNFIDRTVTLQKKHVPESEFSTIQIGDTYNDGSGVVLEIKDKRIISSYTAYNSVNPNGPIESSSLQDVLVTVNMKVREEDGVDVYGEEYILRRGKTINAVTNEFVFEEYTIIDIK